MDDATAKTRLARMVAATDEPTISDAELVELVAENKHITSDGTAVYDLPGAAVEGWRMKAAAAASRVSFNSDGQQMSRSHFFDHCERMIEHYLGASSFTLTVERASDTDYLLAASSTS